MKQFLGYIIKKAVGKGKVSPTIKSVKPFTEKKADQFAGIKSKTPEDRANVIRKRESIKRMDQLDNLKKKREEGIKAGKEMKRMVDTKRAKNVGGTIFSKGIREKKMGGGMMGRRFGMKRGTPKPETNVDKIKKTFAPKRKKKFPDLTGDGKVTFADILKGRGVINGKRDKKVVGGMVGLGKAGLKYLKSKEGKEKLKEMSSEKNKKKIKDMTSKIKKAFGGGNK